MMVPPRGVWRRKLLIFMDLAFRVVIKFFILNGLRVNSSF